ncbi:hypothetical protein OPT61_g9651 [Boeremia exigua]|uniref:Uncharacterized protein n=1 Tax=Boeremia exigua TaxID=749465 RepID=A0ACC2HTT1_9PLEO|nr:hypothetical protein OPT61_g9651 [Boeremia exigua]
MAGAQSEPPYSYFQDLNYGSSVAVNQRALVEKALARFSNKYAAFRELINNAADAAATRVKIQIKTSPNTQSESDISPKPSLDNVRLHVLREVVVQNDGNLFRADDWSRLTSIGQNLDMIGMFGLGFYSVFELTDEPIVVSGAEAVAFRWKGDMLHHEHISLSPDQSIQETQVILKCKDVTTKVPDLIELGRFLACSLAFVQLSSMELWVDDRMILSVSKEIEYSPVELMTQIETGTDHMRIDTIEQGTIHMHATWLDGMYDGAEPLPLLSVQPLVTRVDVFSRPFPNLDSQPTELQTPTKDDQHRVRLSDHGHSEERKSPNQWMQLVRSLDARIRHSFQNDQSSVSSEKEIPIRGQSYGTEKAKHESYATIRVPIVRANISTQIHGELALGIKAITRKEAPGTVSVSIVTPCKNSSHLCPLFDLMMPSDSEAGRIFSGLPTLQSTGLQAHILIPTILDMHRGLVDLTTTHVKVWNTELLQVAGILSRVIWTQEMEAIKASSLSPIDWVAQRKKPILGRKESQLTAAMRLFTLFDVQTSAPDPEVGRVVQDSFWTACKAIDIVSTRGVRNSMDVRLEDRRTAGFMNSVPLLPRYVAERSRAFVTALQNRNLIRNVDTMDIQYELSRNVLTKRQFSHLLEWGLSANAEALESIRKIIKAATIKLPGRTNMALKDVKHFFEYEIPRELVPENAIEYADVGKNVSGAQLQTIGWDPLPVVDWLRLSESRVRIVKDPTTAEKVLTIVSSKMRADEYGEVIKYLPKIPTDRGLVAPEEAYFRLKTPFENLENLAYVKEMPRVRRALLKRMGVRTEVKMSVVVEHLQSARGDASKLNEYVLYLSNMHQPVSEEDRKVLSTARVWHAEAPDQNGYREDATYTLSELFEPSPELRELRVPILYLPQTYQKDSPMGILFRRSGLKPHPSIPDLLAVLVEAISNGDHARRDSALRYLTANFSTNNYQTHDLATSAVKFLPIHGDPTTHVTPSECFTNTQATSLGFHRLAEQFTPYATLLGVKPDPPAEQCVERLLANPSVTARAAADVFEYLWSIRGQMGPYLDRLASAKFVPVFTRQVQDGGADAVACEHQDEPRFLQPNECYTGPFDGEFEELAGLFEYVRIERGARFLGLCGAQATPSAAVIAEKFTQAPETVLSALKSEVYVKWFAWLGEQHRKQPFEIEAVRGSAFIPTVRECNGQSVFELVVSDTAVVYDDLRLFELFRETLHVVPQRGDVESFCRALGCKKPSAAVQTECMPGQQVELDVRALRTRLLAQLQFFLSCLDVQHVGLPWEDLKDNLAIRPVEQINLRWSYQGIVKDGQATAFAERTAERCTLWIVPGKFEACDLSRELAKLVLESPKPVDFLALETILQSGLSVLRTRGYGIERILGEGMVTEEPVDQAETRESRQIIPAPSNTKESSESVVEHREASSGQPHREEVSDTGREGSVGNGVGHNEQPPSPWTAIPDHDKQEPHDILPLATPHPDPDSPHTNPWTPSSAPSSTTPVSKETNELRYLGELYISQLLSSRLAPGSYDPDTHWTSPMRTRNGHTPFTADDDSSPFTLIPGEGELRRAREQ